MDYPKAKILIVDDLQQNLLAMEETLAPLDIEIHTALSGNEALSLMTKHEFAVILLDVQMPGMDGFETAALIGKTKATRETPIIFVTAISQEDKHVSKGYEVGAVDYLFKPINTDILISKVKVFVNLYCAKIENKRLLEEVNKSENLKSLGILAGGIAHDFNNLLAAMSGNIEMAEMLCEPGAEVTTYLERSIKAIARATQLTQQLLTFSKGGGPVKKQASISELVSETSSFMLSGSNCKFHLDIPAGIYHANIDTGQISQVLQNLLKNSMDAMPDGGDIWLSVENCEIATIDRLPLASGDYVKITITDNGPGIDDHIVDKIFDPYFSTKKRGPLRGHGLGLSVCSSIINKHEGYISVQSEQGEGTTFYVYLPAAEKSIASGVSSHPEPEDKDVNDSAKKKRCILVMDDDHMVSDVARTILSRHGYNVVLAENGEEAVKIYAERKDSEEAVDVLIMDLTIPGGMGGEKAVQEIHKLDPEAKVIVSSGYASAPIMSSYRDFGFCAALAKPFRLQELLGTVKKALA